MACNKGFDSRSSQTHQPFQVFCGFTKVVVGASWPRPPASYSIRLIPSLNDRSFKTFIRNEEVISESFENAE